MLESNFSVVFVFEAELPVSFFFHRFQVCFGDICGGEGDDAGDGYHYTLLRVDARDAADNPLERTFCNTDQTSWFVVYLLGRYAIRLWYGCLHNTNEILHFTKRYCHDFISSVCFLSGVVKDKINKGDAVVCLGVAVCEGENLFVGSVNEKYSRGARYFLPVPYAFDNFALAFHGQECWRASL